MDENRQLIDTIISQYFDSVKDPFEFEKKNEFKPIIASIISFLFMIAFVFSLIPILSIEEKDLTFLFSFIRLSPV